MRDVTHRREESRARRLIFCNRFVHPDSAATSQLLADVSFDLALQGFDVTLLGARIDYLHAEQGSSTEEVVNGVRIVRVPSSRFGRGRLSGRVLDYLSYLWGAAAYLRRRVRRGDTVVFMTDPPMMSVFLGGAVRRRNARQVNWVQDLFPEVAEAVLGRGWRALLRLGSRWVRDRSLRAASLNVVISRGMAQRLQERGVDAERIRVICNWADDTSIRPLEAQENSLRRSLGLADSFVVGYSGNLGRAHDWLTLLKTAEALRAAERIRFVLFGDGWGMRQLKQEVLRRGLSNVEFHSYQDRERLRESLTLPDVHWMTLLPALERLILPSKLYGVLAAGRPGIFVGDTQGEVAATLREHACGWSFAPGASREVAEKLLQLAGSPDEVRQAGQRARQALEHEHTRASALQAWHRALSTAWASAP